MHDAVAFRPIELSGEAVLAAEVRARHGGALLAAASCTTRIFELSSPWAPGLRFVGAEADGAHLAGALPIATRFNLAGSGLRLGDAIASCLGECVERLSQVEHPGDVARTASVDDIGPLMPQLRELIARIPATRGVAIEWASARELGSDAPCFVPVDWVMRRSAPGPAFEPNTALSTGTAAGRTFADAAVRGLLELVERDAVALWWLGGRRGRPMAHTALKAAPADVLAQLRQNVRARHTWLLDITSDLGIPVVAALSVASDGHGFVCGTAARMALADAACAAILEMCQMELGLLLTKLRLAERGDAGLSDADKRTIERATEIDAHGGELLHPLGGPSAVHADVPDGDEGRLDALTATFAQHGIKAALIELTRPAFTIPVVRAVAPALQLMPSALETMRLVSERIKSGGGERWTRGLPLM